MNGRRQEQVFAHAEHSFLTPIHPPILVYVESSPSNLKIDTYPNIGGVAIDTGKF